MKRLTALLLACMLLLGTACAGAEETAETPKVVSYDFDLQFHLEADHFPFRERKKAQGYEELLDSLEIKGNYSYCEETDCMDLHISLIPVTNPDAALDFRVFGWVANWLNVSSPLLGEDAVCFRPKDVLSFSIRAWDFFSVPLFPFAILFPGILSSAWSELSEKWVAETEDIGDTLTVEAMDRITEYLKNQLDHDPYVTKLVAAAIQPLQERDLVNDEINRLPDLLPAAAGGQDLTVETGEEAVSYAEAESYDGMILDWMMPEMDGIQALCEMRKKGIRTPCMILTARDAVEDRVRGLDAGADDYLPKPFDAGELLARVRAMLRRRESYVPDVLQWEDLTLDKGSCELKCGGKSTRVTGKMYQLTELFMENPRILFSVQQLMDKVWGWDAEAEVNVVWVNISQLRKKLAELGTAAEIRVHRGTGYSLEKKTDNGAKK